MTQCWHQASGTIELYFYGELSRDEHEIVRRHLQGCAECRRSLEELNVIRTALDARPDIAAPPGGDWSDFMTRLDRAVHQRPDVGATPARLDARRPPSRVIAALSIAALLTLVTIGAFLGLRPRAVSPSSRVAVEPRITVQPDQAPVDAPVAANPKDEAIALTELSEQHFERSKLVVLGLATKDPGNSTGVDWDYERELASSLLSDTRLYRQVAEERGMKSLADVMRDLELVLLQTSMSDTPDSESLAQLQRLIRRRDLITKMDVVKTSGLVP